MLLVPHFSSPRYLFAVTVPAGFRASEPGRAAIRRYHWWVVRAIAASAVIVATMAQSWPDLAVVLAMLPAIAGVASFLRERSKLQGYAAPPPGVREADLAPDGDHLPRWIALALVPLALPLAAAAYLRAHWSEIPERFPVHWGAAGEPNRWAGKTPAAVYGPLLSGAGMMLFLLLLGLAIFYGSRRAPQRTAILKILVACVYFLGFIFTGVGLMPVVRVPIAAFLVATFLFAAAVIAWGYKIVTDPAQPVEATLDQYWYLGSIYCNPQDPAIFVQKRIGFGYTINFGNRMSWLLLGSFLAGMLGLVRVAR